MNYKINTTIVSIFGNIVCGPVWKASLLVMYVCRCEVNIMWGGTFIQEVSIHIAATEIFKGLFWESLSQPNSSELKGRSVCLFTWYIHTLCLQVVRD